MHCYFRIANPPLPCCPSLPQLVALQHLVLNNCSEPGFNKRGFASRGLLALQQLQHLEISHGLMALDLLASLCSLQHLTALLLNVHGSYHAGLMDFSAITTATSLRCLQIHWDFHCCFVPRHQDDPPISAHFRPNRCEAFWLSIFPAGHVLPELTELSLVSRPTWGCTSSEYPVTSAELQRLVGCCPALESLDILVAGPSHMRLLSNFGATAAEAEADAEAQPNQHGVCDVETQYLDVGLHQLLQLTSLASLRITRAIFGASPNPNSPPVPDAEQLASLTRLKSLTFYDSCVYSNAAVLPLTRLRELTHLSFRGLDESARQREFTFVNAVSLGRKGVSNGVTACPLLVCRRLNTPPTCSNSSLWVLIQEQASHNE